MRMKRAYAVSMLASSIAFGEPKIILDTDFGSDSDDLGALAMIHRFMDTGECELLGIAFTKSEIHGVSAIDAVNRYYGHPDIPIGARPGGDWYNDWFYSKALADRFPHEKSKQNVETATVLYRNLLAVANDQSITVVAIGPLFNICDLLKTEGDALSPLSGKDLFNRKVKEFVVMGGKFPEGDWECNFAANDNAGLTRFVFENITVPITFSGYEVGLNIKTGQVFNDPDTPLYIGYLHFFQNAPWIKQYYKGEMRDNASFDQTAVLYAVRGGIGTWWDRSAPGTCLPDEKGGNTWAENPEGTHTYLKLTADTEEMASLLESIMLHKK